MESLSNAIIRMRERIWWFRGRLFPGRPVTINYLFHPRFKLHPAGQIARLAYVGFFERSLIRHAFEYIKPGMLAVDVGANIGLWSIWLGLRVGPRGHVYAFEPGKDTVTLLNSNLRLNRISSIVSVCPQAAGNRLGPAFLSSPSWGGDADRFVSGSSMPGDQSFEQIEMITLDHWAQTQRLAEGVQFIKVDCEGSELGVLQGATGMLTRTRRCMVVCEYNDEACARQGYRAYEIVDWLERHGFVVGFLHSQTKRWICQRPPEGFNGNLVARKG